MFYNNNNNNNEPIPTVNVAGEAGTKLINYTQESGGKRQFIFEVRAASRGFLFAKEELEESEWVPETAMRLGRLFSNCIRYFRRVWAELVVQFSAQHNWRSLNGATPLP